MDKIQNVLKRVKKEIVKTLTVSLQGCNSVKRWYNNHLRKKQEGAYCCNPSYFLVRLNAGG